MSKKSDDSIDRIFRQALTQYDTKFHEDDWLKMEKLLNEEIKRKAAVRSKRIKGTAYTLTGLTGLFIVVYFLALRNPSGSIATLSDSVTEMQASEALTDNGNVKRENPSEGLLSQSSPKESTKVEETESIALPDANNSKDQSSAIDSKKLSEPSGEGKKTQDTKLLKSSGSDNAYRRSDETKALLKKSGSPFSNRKSGERVPSFQTQESDKPGLDPSNKSNPSLTPPGKAEDVEAVDDKLSRSDDGLGHNLPASSGESGKGTLNNYQETRDQPKSNSGASLPEQHGKDIPAVVDSASITEETTKTSSADSASVVESPSADKSKPSSRWSVAFVIAPEFSTTKLTSYSSPGESYGLRIGYQLSNKLSVNMGLIRSQKKYEGAGEGYNPRNPAYWQIRTNGVVPEEIYSKCLVYELPLGLQFDAIQTSKSRVFVSTAISSYFMISQAYDYTFQSPNPGADTGWRSRGSESYWFSVGMVSAGYERYLTRSFAIGIEPYLKISLSEIGWPNIKLYSTGAYVTLRYKFMSRRNF